MHTCMHAYIFAYCVGNAWSENSNTRIPVRFSLFYEYIGLAYVRVPCYMHGKPGGIRYSVFELKVPCPPK